MVTITHIYESSSLDVDNIPKPILDALKGLVYSDDTQVTDLLCRKRFFDGELDIPHLSTLFLETLDQSMEFVHVSVTDTSDRKAELW